MPRETPKGRGERLAMYEAFTESGQTLTEFGKERGITYWRVKSAVNKTEAELQKGSSFKEVSLPGPIVGSGGEYSVTLRNGRELQIPAHFTEKRVRQLIEILETC